MQARLGLLLTAFIWGSTFIAQRLASDVIGPMSFNALRFALATGALLLITRLTKDTTPTEKPPFSIYIAGSIIGTLLFCGSLLQQTSIAYTTAGKTAFITALYIVMVPLVGLFFKHRLSYLAIAGIFSAVSGIGLMTLNETLTMQWADFLLIVSTFFWTAHILTLDYVSVRYPAIRLTTIQFAVGAVLNTIVATTFETLTWSMVTASWIPLLYSGILSCAIGFTLQTVYQRIVPPTEAALLLSLEMVFAAGIGWFWLHETMTSQELLGVLLLSLGVIAAQIPVPTRFTVPPIRL